MAMFETFIKKFALPVSTHITKPCVDETFWVNVIGRGYISPTRNFRWYIDRMKIALTTSLIKRITASSRRTMKGTLKGLLTTGIVLAALLSVETDARCKKMWDTAAIARSGQAPTATIPLKWFIGIDIVRRKIDEQSSFSTKLYLCDASQPNAFATRERGRNITAITTGMYRLLGNDWHGYASIVGHENAHLVLHHGPQRVLQDIVFNKIADQTDIPVIGVQAFSATFSRKEEYQADKHGLRYALCAGFSPGGAIRMHEKLNSSSTFLHNHPSSKSRIRALELIAKAHQRTPRCKS